LVALFAILAIAGLAACGDDGGGIEEETTTIAEQTATTEEGSDDDADDDSGGDSDLPDGQQPGDLGGDDDLDAVADVCFEGDMVGCDILYSLSDAGSDYEAYGDTCAGRQDAGTGDLCTNAFEGFPLPDGQVAESLGDDRDLDELADECFEGDMGSCDTLYEDSPGGSDYEIYGVTCGGRLPTDIGDLLIDEALSNGVEGPCEDAYASAS
jgi:hypothetical protein